MAFLDGLYSGGGSRRRIMASKGTGAGRRPSSAVAAARPVRQLYWKLRSRLRSSKRRHAGGAAARFGYDLQSYSRNFDDGLVVSG